ncbi:MAG: aminotransferase class V-fold PLP-dependent enzyme [Acidobacteria bacterium]|nr:aminotransferase class V-fold PLP-dependent enzyme [Acidobacteriota bacterium]
MTDPLLAWRGEFPVLNRTLYMISHSLGAMPARTRQCLTQYADQWDNRSIRAWEEGWWTMPVTTGNLIANIIGAPPASMVMQPNVTVAQWIVLSCFDWRGIRNKVVSEAMNFPTNLYILGELDRLGARFVKVPSRDGITIAVDDMLTAIDEETQLVCISHVLFRSAYIQDVKAIIEKAHRAGAQVVVDIYQSAGTVPVDVTSWQVDFAVGGSVKWLCGGPGAGYLYVRPDLVAQLRPRLTGWMAHASPFSFADDPIDYAGDMFRFLHGTPAVPALFAAKSGYEIINEVGVDRIREKSIRQTTRLIETALAEGIPVRSPMNTEDRGGAVILDVPNGYAITQELLRRDVLLDYRPGAGIRLAPHFYTTDDEVDEVLRQIVALRDQRST